jgi:hypothetical protein
MSRYSEKHIRKDSWVKEMLKTYNPELLAGLIEKRIKHSNSTGPYVINNETSVDIINAYATEGPDDFKEKIEPAVGLLLYKALHGQMEASNEFLRHIFLIIRESRLVACHMLLQNWINKNSQFLVSKKVEKQDAMRDALYALSRIQNKDPNIEEYWLNIWREGQSAFWCVAFHGLRLQNPEAACKELPLLVSRRIINKMDKTHFLVSGMWHDSRPQLLNAIRKGLDENSGWAGLILNTLLEKMDDKQKNEVMESLKETHD